MPLLAIEDAKSDEYYKAADMISGVLDQLAVSANNWPYQSSRRRVQPSVFTPKSGDHS